MHSLSKEARSAGEWFSEAKSVQSADYCGWRKESKTALKNKPKNVIRKIKCWVKYISGLAFMFDSDVRNPTLKT